MIGASTLHPDEVRPCPDCAADLSAVEHDAAHRIWSWNSALYAAARRQHTMADQIKELREERRQSKTRTEW